VTAITVIVPTFGRSTLKGVIDSIVPQMEPQDQFIVSWDGQVPEKYQWVLNTPKVEVTQLPEKVGDYGCTPNDNAAAQARGDFIWFIGDDDFYMDNALSLIREKAAHNPQSVQVFMLLYQNNRVLHDSIGICRISAQQVVVPNTPNLPKWADYPPGTVQTSDWSWIDRTIKMVGKYVFHDYITCHLREHNKGAEL